MVASPAVVPARDLVASNLLPPIYFAPGTTHIRPGDAKILDAHAVWLRRDRKQVLLIEGHTDGPEDSAFSREIGEQRARSARAYLVSRGALADHIVILSGAGGRPACKEKTAACRAINRRVTFSTGGLP
jgi:peptidoglycan-associated lipoprotein